MNFPPMIQKKQLFPQVAIFDGKTTQQTFHLSPNKASHHNDCTIWDFEIETKQGCGSTHINNKFPRMTLICRPKFLFRVSKSASILISKITTTCSHIFPEHPGFIIN